jgi:hypothetical protein
MRLPDVTASLDGLAPHVPSLHISISCYQDDDVKTYLCSPLCRFTFAYAYAYPPLSPLSLISFPVLSATSLQQDVCRRLILGYNRRYFISLLILPPKCYVSILLTTLNCAASCDVLLVFLLHTRGLAELFFRVWQSRRLHHRSGR